MSDSYKSEEPCQFKMADLFEKRRDESMLSSGPI